MRSQCKWRQGERVMLEGKLNLPCWIAFEVHSSQVTWIKWSVFYFYRPFVWTVCAEGCRLVDCTVTLYSDVMLLCNIYRALH